ncbi:jg2667, partial [Pararge aegeria aegeria]
MSTSVKDFGKASWVEVYNRIIGAVVFLDDYSAECLHWDGGLFKLLSGGAVAVKRLASVERCKNDQRKAVFITQTNRDQLRAIGEIIRNSNFTHCILVSCVSLDVVYLELNDGLRDVTDTLAAGRAAAEGAHLLEQMLLSWNNKRQSVMEVVYIPIFTIAPTNVVFLTPPYQKVYPKFDKKLTTNMPTLDLYTLSSDERSQMRRLASALNTMFESMNLKEDIFYMGPFSLLLAGVLENSPVYISRRK